jgi:disulfide bond formation protein DsbB
MMQTTQPRSPSASGISLLWLLVLLAAATIGAAWYYELVLGYVPCKLCLEERIPYYAGIQVAVLALVAPAVTGDARLARALALLAGLIFLVGAGLGGYHAGVEWHFWPGPADCSGRMPGAGGSAGDLLAQMKATRVISCDEAHWWLFGLSFAGWNAVISLVLAGLGFSAFLRLKR